jgi:hypothetical protein
MQRGEDVAPSRPVQSSISTRACNAARHSSPVLASCGCRGVEGTAARTHAVVKTQGLPHRPDLMANLQKALRSSALRVRVEIMGSQKCRIVGKSQSVLIMINPIIFTRTRSYYPQDLR